MATDKEKKPLSEVLFNESDIAGDSALMEQYKLFLGMLDRISERRQHANSFFLSINTGVCALIGYMYSKDTADELKVFFWITPLAGILLSYFWFRLIKSYRDLNSAKFKVVYAIEERLPLSPFKAEWHALGEAKDPKVYTPFTHLEIWVPRCFIAMYLLIVAMMIPLSSLASTNPKENKAVDINREPAAASAILPKEKAKDADLTSPSAPDESP